MKGKKRRNVLIDCISFGLVTPICLIAPIDVRSKRPDIKTETAILYCRRASQGLLGLVSGSVAALMVCRCSHVLTSLYLPLRNVTGSW